MKRFYVKKFFSTIRLVEIYKVVPKFGISLLFASSDGCKLRKCIFPSFVCKNCPFVLRLSL